MTYFLRQDDLVDRTVPVVTIEQPGLSYESDEFVVRKEPESGLWYAGSDGGCSCYSGFDPSNFEPFDSVGKLRERFHRWIGGWYDGVGQEAAAWEEFNTAIRA